MILFMIMPVTEPNCSLSLNLMTCFPPPITPWWRDSVHLLGRSWIPLTIWTWNYWKKVFGEIIEFHVPLKRAPVRKKILSWISQEIRLLMRAGNYHCTKAKKTKKSKGWEQYKRLRNLVTLEMRRSKLQYSEELDRSGWKLPKCSALGTEVSWLNFGN